MQIHFITDFSIDHDKLKNKKDSCIIPKVENATFLATFVQILTFNPLKVIQSGQAACWQPAAEIEEGAGSQNVRSMIIS